MSPSDQQHLLAIEINALRMMEIATLRRECEFWRERCRVLEAVVHLPARTAGRRARQTRPQKAANPAAVAA